MFQRHLLQENLLLDCHHSVYHFKNLREARNLQMNESLFSTVILIFGVKNTTYMTNMK